MEWGRGLGEGFLPDAMNATSGDDEGFDEPVPSSYVRISLYATLVREDQGATLLTGDVCSVFQCASCSEACASIEM
jgi:hypothetical protein